MKVRFFSYLTAFHVISIYLSPRSYNEIYYFNISKIGDFLLGLFRRRQQIKLFEFSFSEIKDNSGENYFPRIYGKDLISVCDVIEEEIFKKNPFINTFGKMFNLEKVRLYFRKIAGREVNDIVVFINIIVWYRQQFLEGKPDEVEFSIEKTPFFDILKEFALKEHDVVLSSHFSLRKFFKYFYRFGGNLYLSTLVCIKTIIDTVRVSNGAVTQGRDNRIPLISSLYSLKGFTFDLIHRCDFPWLLMSNTPHEQVLIYFERKDAPATDDMVDILEQQRINFMAMSNGAAASKRMPVYKPSIRAAKLLFDYTVKILFLAYKEILNRRLESLVYLSEALHFIREYSKAYDFYYSNGIKINIDFIDHDPYRIARHLALEANGGVSISHQASNWPIPNVILGSCADIMFLFGPYYYQTFIRSGTCNHSIIFCGYITDYSFIAVKERSEKLREKLVDNGAKFVICYFDENSSDGRMSVIPNSRSVLIYKHFLNWVLLDKTIGLICSPKRPKTLQVRLSEITGLIKKAKDTGRCIFMEGEYAAKNYPTEAAQASDIVISLLLGGTTSLENFLSGARVVYLDLEGLYSYPEYKWGRDTIVFDDIDNLMSAINKYRSDSKSFDELGNINMVATIKQKDPFHDGKAAERMGRYINWLLEMFNQGKTREKAIEYANEKYAKIWGSENITRIKG
ncbi:MAG: hypothetical protein HY959_01290 [Ignavibacteriae bacterium]|nr:hypothetical protein [Ignavibacteriota bacterium]